MDLKSKAKFNEKSNGMKLETFIEKWNYLIENGQPITDDMRNKFNKFASNKGIFLIRYKVGDGNFKIHDYSDLAKEINLDGFFNNTGRAGFYSVVKNWNKLLKKLTFIEEGNVIYVFFKHWRTKGSVIVQKGPTSQWTLYETVTEKISNNDRISLLKKHNLTAPNSIPNFDLRKLKFSIKAISKVLEANLHKILSSNDLSKHVRKHAKQRASHFIDSSITAALFSSKKFKLRVVDLEKVLSSVYDSIGSLDRISDNELRTIINQKIIKKSISIQSVYETNSDIINIDDLRLLNPLIPVTGENTFINVRGKQISRAWYEVCEDSYLIAITKFIVQDKNIRRALNFNGTKVVSIYCGQGLTTPIVSCKPDIITVSDDGFITDLIQVKQISFTKPRDPIHLFRDIIKTAGFVNNQAEAIGRNVFFIKNSDLSSLEDSIQTNGNNLVVIGYWTSIKSIQRFGEVAEALREIAKGKSKKIVAN